MSTLSRNSRYGPDVSPGRPRRASSGRRGWIEKPCRWNGWCAPVVFVHRQLGRSSPDSRVARRAEVGGVRVVARRRRGCRSRRRRRARRCRPGSSSMSWAAVPSLAGAKVAGLSSVAGRGAERLDRVAGRGAQRRAGGDRVRRDGRAGDVEVHDRHRRDVREAAAPVRSKSSVHSVSAPRRPRPGSRRRRRRACPGGSRISPRVVLACRIRRRRAALAGPRCRAGRPRRRSRTSGTMRAACRRSGAGGSSGSVAALTICRRRPWPAWTSSVSAPRGQRARERSACRARAADVHAVGEDGLALVGPAGVRRGLDVRDVARRVGRRLRRAVLVDRRSGVSQRCSGVRVGAASAACAAADPRVGRRRRVVGRGRRCVPGALQTVMSLRTSGTRLARRRDDVAGDAARPRSGPRRRSSRRGP